MYIARYQRVGTAADILHHAVHLLGPVTHPDRKDQKRNQYGIGGKIISKQWQTPHLPNDRDG